MVELQVRRVRAVVHRRVTQLRRWVRREFAQAVLRSGTRLGGSRDRSGTPP
jgi:hypothetical protein